MGKKRDYYDILGIDKSASAKEIKKSYRKLAMKYHPDKAEESDKEKFTEKFKEISEAYAVLSDEEKKQKYDQFGHAGMDGFSQEDIFRNVNFEDIFQGFGGDGQGFGGIGDILSEIFGGGGRSRRTGPQRGSDLYTEVDITLKEASKGVEKEIRIRHDEVCSRCNGSGAEPGSDVETCEVCGGSGQERRIQNGLFGQQIVMSMCRACNGTGKIFKDPCHECHGRGTVNEIERVNVKIPAGAEDENRIRIPNAGNAGEFNGGYGDLYVSIHVKPHKDFKRGGNDLYTDKQISFVQACLGDKVDVKTIYGVVELNIPPGTQSESKFKLRGQGMPILYRSSKGNLYVTIKVVVPQKLNDKQKSILEEFSKVSGDEIKTIKKGFFDKVKEGIHH
ncbi:MAG: molecular chaperone DnaJ [Methanobrevibacter sp.]|nr:molecular chaperone DnaJ [Candidatus Methanovirga meridionalis]